MELRPFLIVISFIGSSFELQDESQGAVNNYLEELSGVLKSSNDSANLQEFFTEGFEFRGCQGSYNRSQITELLITSPNISVEHSDIFLGSFIVSATCLKTRIIGAQNEPIDAFFIFHENQETHGTLAYGEDSKCHDTLKNNCEQLKNAMKQFTMLGELGKFWKPFAESIKNNDIGIIAPKIAEDFEYRLCDKLYNFEDLFNMLYFFSSLFGEFPFEPRAEGIQIVGEDVHYTLEFYHELRGSEKWKSIFVLKMVDGELQLAESHSVNC